MNLDAIRSYFQAQQDQIRTWRRTLHEIPELGFEEIETTAYIEKQLQLMEVPYSKGIGVTGIVAHLGRGEKNKIALRADMDGLPIQEENQVSYQSKHAGLMHACGHDAHVAMLLGVVGYIKSIEPQLSSEIIFVFQPAEERSDGNGLTGARYILQSGWLDGVKAMLGMHVMSNTPSGCFGIVPGGVMASGDLFMASIYGKGGHDAWVHETIDPIFISTQVLNAIYAIRSRKIDPLSTGTLSIGTIEGGSTANVIPECVKISGTIRTFDQKVRDTFVAELEKALKLSEGFGGRYELTIPFHVPVTQNSPYLAGVVRKVCVDLFGPNSLAKFQPVMGVEDFSWYSLQIPSLFIALGSQLEGELRPHHNPRFDIDDSVLYMGSALMTAASLALLDDETIDSNGELI
jgi:amidohydrolase